jgi:hypothetical protein
MITEIKCMEIWEKMYGSMEKHMGKYRGAEKHMGKNIWKCGKTYGKKHMEVRKNIWEKTYGSAEKHMRKDIWKYGKTYGNNIWKCGKTYGK